MRSKITHSVYIVACVAWRFKQFERECIKRLSRENERRSSEVSLSQAPRGLDAPYHGFPAFLASSNCLKTPKLRRLCTVGPNEYTNTIGKPVPESISQGQKNHTCGKTVDSVPFLNFRNVYLISSTLAAFTVLRLVSRFKDYCLHVEISCVHLIFFLKQTKA